MIRRTRTVARDQLELSFDAPATVPVPAPAAPADPAASLFQRLCALGLRGIRRCTLTSNRSTMVSFRADALRVHRAFVGAPTGALQAVVRFVNGRGRVRREARRALRAFELPRPAPGAEPVRRRRVDSHPDDAPLAARLRAAHEQLNQERFEGVLRPVAIRVSRRMRSRLGHYAPGPTAPPEIAIARRHARRDGWASVLETLVHEMVHQWQHETGRPVAHDPDFRRKARAVGIAPHSKRPADASLNRPPDQAARPPSLGG